MIFKRVSALVVLSMVYCVLSIIQVLGVTQVGLGMLAGPACLPLICVTEKGLACSPPYMLLKRIRHTCHYALFTGWYIRWTDMLAIVCCPIVWHSFAISYTASYGVPVLCVQQC